METDFTPESEGFDDSEGIGETPLVHPEETSIRSDSGTSYRSFLISGMLPAVNFAADVYNQIDFRDGKHRLDSFHHCRSFAWFVRHKVTNEVRVAANRCNLRWCPLCIKTRKFVIQSSAREWLKTAKKPKFITFTLLHSEDPLSVQIDRLYSCFRKIRHSKLWTRHIKGGLWFFQIKQSKKDGLFHPHIHSICDGSYIVQQELSALWLSITGDSKIVDIRAVKDPKKVSDYVSRYAAAPCRLEDFDLSAAIAVFDALSGRRICGTFGTGKSIQLSPKRIYDADSFEYLGSFWDIFTSKDFDNYSSTIFLAWKTGCKTDIVSRFVKPPPPTFETSSVSEPETYKQLSFNWKGDFYA